MAQTNPRTKISDNNSAAIPADIRDSFCLIPGDLIEWEEKDEGAFVRPIKTAELPPLLNRLVGTRCDMCKEHELHAGTHKIYPAAICPGCGVRATVHDDDDEEE